VHKLARDLRSEWCIGVVGEVRSRGANVNDKLATGAIEVCVKGIEVFSRAETPPFRSKIRRRHERSLRLKYRYLDLRRPKLQRNMITRSRSRASRATTSASTASSRSRRRSW
jgi:aspartyl-tRNA synthetase